MFIVKYWFVVMFFLISIVFATDGYCDGDTPGPLDNFIHRILFSYKEPYSGNLLKDMNGYRSISDSFVESNKEVVYGDRVILYNTNTLNSDKRTSNNATSNNALFKPLASF
ncbi:MAG: hypothetical protein HQK91_06970 [Nitrospirae bacterium]|nr:hypothetical protein [Nitrospirota bacterium]MBF0541175.1 hypothetical protein [Nitrospirota bacterium]